MPSINKTKEGEKDDHTAYRVAIRQVNSRMDGQHNTGNLLWGASRIMAYWIHFNRDLFKDKKVLEVGSGLGLCGIVAASYCKEIVITDYQELTLRALEYNISINVPWVEENCDESSITCAYNNYEDCIMVQKLDWDKELSPITIGSSNTTRRPMDVDIIIASDIICEPSTAEGFLKTVKYYLKPCTGVAYMVNANSFSRFGVNRLLEMLKGI